MDAIFFILFFKNKFRLFKKSKAVIVSKDLRSSHVKPKKNTSLNFKEKAPQLKLRFKINIGI